MTTLEPAGIGIFARLKLCQIAKPGRLLLDRITRPAPEVAATSCGELIALVKSSLLIHLLAPRSRPALNILASPLGRVAW